MQLLTFQQHLDQIDVFWFTKIILLDGDIEAILIFLRNTSFGPEYKVNLIDPQTQKTFTGSIILDELNIKKPDVKPEEDGSFSTTLPKSNVSIKVKPLTMRDSIELEKTIESYPVGRVAPVITMRLLKQIVELNGTQDKGEIAKFIETMPIADSKFIRSFLNANEPRLDLNREVIAPSGEKVNVVVTFGVEFFRPFF